MLGTKPSVREQRERPAVHRGGGQDKLLQEVTGEQGPHERRGGDTRTSRQRKRHPRNRMWKGTGLLDWPVEFQQPKGDKCCRRLTQGKLGGVWLQA